MNDNLADMAIAALVKGQRVIYATWDAKFRREMYKRICVVAEQIVNRTTLLVNGSYHIQTSTGGQIDLHLFRGEGWRGCTADLVLVDETGWNPRLSEQRLLIESSLSLCCVAYLGHLVIEGGAAS